MNRAERRRKMKAEKKAEKPATYSFTMDELRNQVDITSKEFLQKHKEEITDEAIHTALMLLFSLPMKVLKDNYWKKQYKKRIPEFNEKLLDLFNEYQNGKLDIEQLEAEAWIYSGVKLDDKDVSDEPFNMELEVSYGDGSYVVNAEMDYHRDQKRYITVMCDPWTGEDERVFYGHTLGELKTKIEKQLREWKLENRSD